MRRMPVLTLILGLLAAPALAERQPVSTSLADCAAITINLGLLAASTGSDVRREQAVRWTKEFVALGYAQARAEGHGDPRAHFDDVLRARLPEWQPRLGEIFQLGDVGQWIDHCRRIANGRGKPV